MEASYQALGDLAEAARPRPAAPPYPYPEGFAGLGALGPYTVVGHEGDGYGAALWRWADQTDAIHNDANGAIYLSLEHAQLAQGPVNVEVRRRTAPEVRRPATQAPETAPTPQQSSPTPSGTFPGGTFPGTPPGVAAAPKPASPGTPPGVAAAPKPPAPVAGQQGAIGFIKEHPFVALGAAGALAVLVATAFD